MSVTVLRRWPIPSTPLLYLGSLPLAPPHTLAYAATRHFSIATLLQKEEGRFRKPVSIPDSVLDAYERLKAREEKALWHKVRQTSQAKSFRNEGQRLRALDRLYAEIEKSRVKREWHRAFIDLKKAVDSWNITSPYFGPDKPDEPKCREIMVNHTKLFMNTTHKRLGTNLKAAPVWIMAPLGEVNAGIRIGRTLEVLFEILIWTTFTPLLYVVCQLSRMKDWSARMQR